MKFFLLGPLEADAGGVHIDLGPAKQRLILAALLLARGRVVPLHDLLESAWPDDPPPSAVGSLQAYLSRARAVLRRIDAGAVDLVRQPPGYRLEGAVIDLDDFERLSDEATAWSRSGQWEPAHQAASTALSLWRGPLLADLPGDSWVVRERRRAEERMERCVETLVTALLGLGRTAEALEQARRLLDLQPLRDQAVWLYMLALHRCARSAEALDAYRAHAAELDSALGLEPAPALRELQTAILREDPLLASWPNQQCSDPEPTDTPRPASPPTVAGAPAVRLVGRDGPMAQAESWLDEMRAGAPRGLLLTGAVGIGKTRLAEEIVRRAEAHGVRVAWSSCVRDEGTPSWWQLRPLVRQLGGDPDELFRVPVGADADATRFVVYGELLEQLAKATVEGPVLVVIDDAQWLDPASARAVAYLLQTIRDLPVGLVLTMCDGQSGPEIDAIRAAFARHSAASQLRLEPLDEAGVSDLVGELAGGTVPESEVLSLGRWTGGNPFLLTEYARLPRAERDAGAIPLAVREVIGRRFDRFDPEAMRVLHAAAVAGDGFEPSVLAAAAGTSVAHVVDVLDVAAHDEIIVPGPEGPGYQFAHALLREHLLGTLSPVRRQATHAALAAAIALNDGPDEDILRRAQHLSAAIPVARPETVVAACRQAAEYAERVWDWEVAARQWAAARAALGLRRGDRKQELHDELLVAEVAALARAGQGRTLFQVVDDALHDASRLRQGQTAARLSRALLRSCGAWAWTKNGQGSSGVLDRLTTAREATRADVTAQIPLLSVCAVGHCYASDLRIPEELNREAMTLAEELGDPDTLADAIVGRVLTAIGVASSSREIATLLDRLAELPHRYASVDAVLRDNALTMAAFNLGDIAAVERHLGLAIAGSDALRLLASRVQLRWVEAKLAHWHGDLDRAQELAVQARQHHEQTELYGAEDNFLSTSLALAWDRGTLADAGPEIRRSADPIVWSAAAAAEAGDVRRGRRLISAALNRSATPSVIDDGATLTGRQLLATDPAGERSHYWYTLGSLCLLAHAVADLEIKEAAPVLLELLTPHVGYFAAIGQTAPIGPVSLPVGRLHALLGDSGAARQAYAAAADAAMVNAGGPTLVRVRAAQAELVAAGADRARQLRAAAQQADRAGLTAVAKRMVSLTDRV